MKTLYIKPNIGTDGEPLKVLKLNGQPLAEAGEEVPKVKYYIRRLKDGSAIEAPRPSKTKTPARADKE